MKSTEIKKVVYFACSILFGAAFAVALSGFLLTIESDSASIFWAFVTVPITFVGIVGLVIFTSEFYTVAGQVSPKLVA